MIDVGALLGIVLVIVGLTLVAVVAGFWMGRTSTTAPYDPYVDKPKSSRLDGLFHSETTTWQPLPDPEEDAEEEDAEQYATLPINPDTPPTWKIYNPRNPHAEVKFCRCHGVEISRGQRVLWWPNPETGGVDLLCEQGVEEAEAVKNG